MRTPCNLLIMNIAIADLAVAVIAAPLRSLEIYYHSALALRGLHVQVPVSSARCFCVCPS